MISPTARRRRSLRGARSRVLRSARRGSGDLLAECCWPPRLARAALLMSNNTPFPRSSLIVGAAWASRDYAAARQPARRHPADRVGRRRQRVHDDRRRGHRRPGAPASCGSSRWPGSSARRRRSEVRPRRRTRSSPRPPQLARSATTMRCGPVRWGPYYSSGLVEADRCCSPPRRTTGAGARTVCSPAWPGSPTRPIMARPGSRGDSRFPAPLGNLSWVIRGEGGNYADG